MSKPRKAFELIAAILLPLIVAAGFALATFLLLFAFAILGLIQ